MKLSRDEKDRIVGHFKELFEESVTLKYAVAGPSCNRWDEYEYYYLNGSRTPPQTPWWWADVKVNLLRSRVDRIIGLYTGERPVISFDPQEPEDNLLAEYLGGVCENDWSNGGWDRELRYVMGDAAKLGTGIWKVFYDEINERIRVRRLNPRNFFVSADADMSLNDAEFVGEVVEVPLSKVLAMHPDLLDDPDYGSTETVSLEQVYGIGIPLPNMLPIVRMLNTDGFSPSMTRHPYTTRTRVQYGQFYVRDVASMEWLLTKESRDALKKDRIQGAVVITMAANRILSIEKSPYRKEWHPYVVFRTGMRSDSWWGDGDVVGLMRAQDGLDIIVSRTCQHVQATVNPWYVGDSSARGDVPSNWQPVPNEILWVNGGKEVITAQRPPDLPGSTIGVLEQLINLFDDRSGVEASVQGRHQAGVTSGEQEKALQQQFSERNKPRLDDRDESLRLFGRKYADLALDVYSEKHVKRVLGDRKASDWDELKKTKRGDMDIRVQVGAGVSGDPEAVMNLAMQLLDRQILGDPNDPNVKIAILEIVRKVWPGADNFIRVIKKEKDSAREMEAMQMSGQLPPPPEPQAAPPEPAMAGAPV